ncbi:fimbrial protein [Yersinia enterocolitica]|uniref:Exported pilin protein n=1 Tax=Yersinia enterocolitica serotype O:8 / biotype 1B (strain NCTC 13174 / 8081) TaxID=393305 RepID=A1JJV0_YERE8|nr:fimbrial protein [Yersinia enterocolitica]AJI83249.1 fimbrial family protein [Yersinia enterocolitica]AJJ24985.1 fimbrial family protein [Yersinia enterocolitica]EKA29022.1 exported pilin protein [Yersinia enterocolitica subsp. enterocolitica WA-314]KGA72596.1 fimbrial family protein [Yersinia enterocolitica]PNM12041.1 type 1 fimbrial protein [Yersinia enterocolitica]
MTNLNLLMRVGKAILSILILNVFWAIPVLAADNMRFHGALVAEPCTIRPGDDAISLNFGTVVDKYLYSNQRTLGKQFQIHLVDCDISLGTTANIIFTGNDSVNLPGLLAVDSSDMGIAIGLETLAGKPLYLNQSSDDIALDTGNNIITLKAYVRGEPEAISQRTIKRGEFNAVATFNLQYY